MSIVVTCPNGHRLTAPDKRAGTTGHCPACGAKVHIPEKKDAPPSDSSILRVLGISDVLRRRAEEEEEEKRAAEAAAAAAESGQPGPEQDDWVKKNTRTKKICPQCEWEIDAGYKICPKCRYYFVK